MRKKEYFDTGIDIMLDYGITLDQIFHNGNEYWFLKNATVKFYFKSLKLCCTVNVIDMLPFCYYTIMKFHKLENHGAIIKCLYGKELFSKGAKENMYPLSDKSIISDARLKYDVPLKMRSHD